MNIIIYVTLSLFTFVLLTAMPYKNIKNTCDEFLIPFDIYFVFIIMVRGYMLFEFIRGIVRLYLGWDIFTVSESLSFMHGVFVYVLILIFIFICVIISFYVPVRDFGSPRYMKENYIKNNL